MTKTQFLRNPAEIRKAVRELQGGKRLDLAVAFVGADWSELLADHKGKVRAICWLSSTNNNPYAVEDLMKRPNTKVRQRDFMHAKVYVSPTRGAIVGSANLSKAALSESEVAGQDEAAVCLTTSSEVAGITAWFQKMWAETKHTKVITDDDLKRAQRSWDKARQRYGFHGKTVPSNATRVMRVPPIPDTLPPTVLRYARKVRSLDLRDDIGQPSRFIRSLAPERLTSQKRRDLVEQIVSWTNHPGSYKTFHALPIARVRKGLTVLFDPAIDIQTRLQELHDRGLLAGLQIPSMSLLLYWRNPERFPPYNFRTQKFLDDFNLAAFGMSAASPRCYATWLRWSARLAQKLRLPTPGHVDRMIEWYYEEVYA